MERHKPDRSLSAAEMANWVAITNASETYIHNFRFYDSVKSCLYGFEPKWIEVESVAAFSDSLLKTATWIISLLGHCFYLEYVKYLLKIAQMKSTIHSWPVKVVLYL